jgi:hypothetical protein
MDVEQIRTVGRVLPRFLVPFMVPASAATTAFASANEAVRGRLAKLESLVSRLVDAK